MVAGNFKGLTEGQVTESRAKNGQNISGKQETHTFWKVVKDVVFEPLFIILVCAALVYTILGSYQEGIVMLVALAIVSGISLFQENKSRSAMDALKKLSTPHAKVIRDSKTQDIATEDIVVGDVMIVEEGTIVPADGKILEAHDFSVNESILTGEALPVTKEFQGTDNKLFQGTIAMTGACIAEVTAIGQLTELGKISTSLSEIEVPPTPLQTQIKSFVKSMVSVGVVAFVVVWAVNYYLSKSILDGLLHGLTIAMSVLPEEIPVAFSTFMALGAYHLYKNKVIVRNPHTVEALGAATVICTDKTGTITENKMQLSCIYDFEADKTYDYTKEAVAFNPVLEYAMWGSEISPFDMMEKSIHQAYTDTTTIDLRPAYAMVHEYPLSGKPPIMTHVFSDKNNNIIACKGSVEGVLKQCKLSEEQKKSIQAIASGFSAKGFRVLGVANSKQSIDNLPKLQQDFEFDFIGLVGFYDPPKKNIADVLQQFYKAGIQVKIITGDHAETAVTIANQIALENCTAVLTGTEVIDMPLAELQKKVGAVNVYARMFPDAKLKVIEALKANGEVVAMTGDGVNDGPALKAAHIGIAMGMRGSEIAKNAASLILMDDDLVHMVDAVALGRRIYENLKKAIRYIISIHIPIILIVTIPLLLFWKFANFFSPVHVIFLELIMGPTCSIIFENEPIEAGSMSQKPRKMSVTFFSFKELLLSIVQGLVITTACLGLGYYSMSQNHPEAEVRTIIYTTLIFSNLFLTLVNRSFHYSIFTTIRYSNKLISIILTLSLIVLGLSLFLAPVRNIFQFTALPGSEILLCLGASFAGVMWVELYKMWRYRGKRRG